MKLVNFTDKEWIEFPVGKAIEIWINDLSSKMIAAYICGNTYHGMEKHVRMADWEDIIRAKGKDPNWRNATTDLLYDMHQQGYKFNKMDLRFIVDQFGDVGKLKELQEIIERMVTK